MTSEDQEVTQAAPPLGATDTRPRLVVGDDGSPAADVVWLWVNNHRWPGWRISVVTAQVPPIGPPVGSERATPHLWTPTHPRVLFDDQVEVEHLFAEADPRLVLDSCSDAGLVAIGPRGRGLLKQMHLGSTAQWLIGSHRPLAPVVVVRSGRQTQDVLLCVDGSDHARRALEAVAALPWLASCHVSVLGVDDGPHRTGEAVEHAAEVLRVRGAGQVDHDVVSALTHTTEFDTRSTILATIAERAPDLVAVGARGTGGLRGLLVGSVAAAVVSHAPCSVLVARNG